MQVLAVFVGGGLGALCRFGLQQIGPLFSEKIYYTFLANISGCLLIGLVFALLQAAHASRNWELLLITGFLGGYTTYSTYSLEIVRMMADGMLGKALIYALTTVVGAIAACWLGMWAGRGILKMI